jgi:hypothetical protein
MAFTSRYFCPWFSANDNTVLCRSCFVKYECHASAQGFHFADFSTQIQRSSIRRPQKTYAKNLVNQTQRSRIALLAGYCLVWQES